MTMGLISILTGLAGSVAILIGIGALLAPQFSSGMFGVRVEGSALAFVRAAGIRDFFLGCMVLLLRAHREDELLAYTFFLTAVVAFCDAYFVYRNGSKLTSCTHIAGAIISAGLGFLLLRSVS